MQSIFIEGGGKRQKELTFDVSSFAIDKLFPKIKNYIININLGSDRNNCFEWDNREYEININKLQTHDDFVTAIFHELVHVKQYIYGQMKDYSYKNYEEYINHPIEKEAYKLQEELLDQWKIMKKPTSKHIDVWH